ncbi:MAG: diguanylate cyclase response regulator [Epsilonproteobacteria bacterium]|nr:MAG: diguanylate cyclase response regulator [Campylobacterota bacterium]
MELEKPKILIVDDNPGNIDFLIELLSDYDVSAVIDGRSALEMIHEEKPDLILLDINMPGLNGYETCKLIKASPKTEDIPIIFLSGKTDTESIITGFDAGGVDYITKPYRPKEVLVRVQTQLKLKEAIEALEKMANEDPLTGIANRRRFFERANIMLSTAKVTQKPYYVFVFDLDKFKIINDTYGHDVGDEVIKMFVQIVNDNIDDDDCFARMGGDEFILVMIGVDKDTARKKIDLIRKGIASVRSIAGIPLQFATSIGAAMLAPGDKKLEMIIKRADEKLYKVKALKNGTS